MFSEQQQQPNIRGFEFGNENGNQNENENEKEIDNSKMFKLVNGV